MEELSKSFPEGLEYRIVYNPTVFVRESIDAVIHTLFEAVALVVLVVLVFLQNWRASADPAARDPGVAHRHVRGHGGVRLLAQHAVALRPRARDRHRRRRRDRRGRERRAPHRGGPAAARGGAQGDGRGDAARSSRSPSGSRRCSCRRRSSAASPGSSTASSRSRSRSSTLLSAFNSLTLSPALCALLLQPHGAREGLVRAALGPRRSAGSSRPSTAASSA